ncbi:MAG: phage GP46 family protein [Chitinispirillaceae bacterium]|nr:phage GP46 family protein [Chitinispirillaceae bacterium]
MPRDFELAFNPDTGELDFVYDEEAKNFRVIDDCRNNLVMSVAVAQASFWAAPSFGSRSRDVRKIAADAAEEIAAHIRSATRWLVDSGRCRAVDVMVEEDTNEPGRMNVEVTGRQADGRNVPFTTFLRVI